DTVAVRVDGLEAEILKFAKQCVQPQAVRDGSVDFERFAGNATALFDGYGAECAHVVKAVCQLDQNDADVARHGQKHLAKTFGLLFGLGGIFQALQLGDTVDDFSDVGTKPLGDFLFGDILVFDDVVQQGRHEGGGVKLPAGTDFSDGDGV